MIRRPTPRFAFLIHPLVPFHRRLVGARRLHVPTMLGGEGGVDVVGPGAAVRMATAAGDVEALIIGLPDLPQQLVGDQNRALALGVRAIRAAEAHGASVIGLANALGVIAGRGAMLQHHTSLPVTSGQAATTWACAEITKSALARAGLRRGPVGVLGFTGTVGDGVASLLAAQGIEVRVEAIGPAVARRAEAVGCLSQPLDQILTECRVLVGAATTGPNLAPSRVRRATLLVDLALPPTLEPGPLPDGFKRISGEALIVPGALRGGFWGWMWLFFAGYGQGRVFACFAEPAAMALTGERNFSGGRRLDLDRVRAVGSVLGHLGFRAVAG